MKNEMNRQNRLYDSKYGRLALVAGLVLLLDQLSKAVILHVVPLYETIAVVPGFFNITHIHNPGGAFGFLAGQGPFVRHVFFLGMSALAACLIFYFYVKTPPSHPFLAVGFALIMGGAIGNMIDRLRFEKVVDFLDFYIGSYHWPAFNVADSAISVGMGVFVYHFLFKKMPE